jgi:uncharacterized protein YegP (UPF0339 family)
MATATKKARTAQPAARSRALTTPSEFLVFENNDGNYHWAIVSSTGTSLAQSEAFGSFAAAEQAAGDVRDAAAGARLEIRSGDARAA